MKKAVRDAMRKAKELEEKRVPSREEILKAYKDGMTGADKLRKLLKPAWFVRHKVKSSRKRKPSGNVSSGKKKGL